MAKEIPPLALTFDDVSLVPAFSEIHPQETAVDTIFTRNIKLNIPLVSAAMDTVTESTMAIAIARQGGIGVIHKNLSIDSQAEEVDMVKRSEAGMITNPITIAPDRKVGEALDMMKKFRISGVPVVDPKGKLLGILTNRDLRFEDRTDLLVSELMTKENLKTARSERLWKKRKSFCRNTRSRSCWSWTGPSTSRDSSPSRTSRRRSSTPMPARTTWEGSGSRRPWA